MGSVMNVITFFVRLFHSRILYLTVVVLIAMVCVTPVLCGEIDDEVKAGHLAKVEALLKEIPGKACYLDRRLVFSNKFGEMPLHLAASAGD
jgi:hypothetical protein